MHGITTLFFFTHQVLLHLRLYEAWATCECAVGIGRSIKQIANRTAVTKCLVADDTYVLTHKASLNIRQYFSHVRDIYHNIYIYTCVYTLSCKSFWISFSGQ